MQVEEHVKEECGPLQVFLMHLINIVLFCTYPVPCAIPGTENSTLNIESKSFSFLSIAK